MQVLEPGTRVRVKRLMPPGHVRTPAYLRGATGAVERVLGPFGNPEQLAYRHTPDRLPVYRVRFRLADLWPGWLGRQAGRPGWGGRAGQAVLDLYPLKGLRSRGPGWPATPPGLLKTFKIQAGVAGRPTGLAGPGRQTCTIP